MIGALLVVHDCNENQTSPLISREILLHGATVGGSFFSRHPFMMATISNEFLTFNEITKFDSFLLLKIPYPMGKICFLLRVLYIIQSFAWAIRFTYFP